MLILCVILFCSANFEFFETDCRFLTYTGHTGEMVAGQAWVVLYRRNHIGIDGSRAIGIDGRLWIGTGGGFQSEWVSGSEWNMHLHGSRLFDWYKGAARGVCDGIAMRVTNKLDKSA